MSEVEPTATAVLVLEKLAGEQFSDVYDMLAPNLRGLLSVDALRAGWITEIERIGRIRGVGDPLRQPAGPPGASTVVLPVAGEKGATNVAVSVDDSGQLVALALIAEDGPQPDWHVPEYADPDMLDEREVTVGSGQLAVAGTLTMPRLPHRCPAVVLLAGSGPQDRDETIGPNKPFKDLAWGLATRGIVVLRFDKVTYAHPREIAEIKKFSLTNEYVDHAVAAVRLLQSLSEHVDPARVFVLGHSLGGTAAPRVGATEPSIAGLVIMAGGTYPLHRAALRQARYLSSLNPETSAAAQASIESMSNQAALVDSLELSPQTPDNELPFGVPAHYWLDLRHYDSPAVAADLNKPILVLQGGRDYQATVAEDLAGWQAALADRPNVTIRVYPQHNHLFVPGAGPSSPAEYRQPDQHMDPVVVDDIATWLTTQGNS
ncbi:hypothetical protein FOS14_03470 [Skermania sp. ID1734]|uniref:alpha/beta hydrolase n=1 Tax=Skermania sp. ID1734 TaxID=2597516 RepID=UPI00117CE0D1|nr:alpha/beta fold hydrolase [Skermania sp. ID1734]TSE01603.1 hypothetical protein FOS14_03470 [Skermania sp. ID1734]